MEQQPETMTAKEVAEYLRMEVKSVYRHFEALGGFKVGCLVRFKRSQIMKMGEPEEKAEDVTV